MTTSMTGRAATDRAARYAKQLCSHLGRGFDTDYHEGLGTIRRDASVATFTATDNALEIAISATHQDDLFTLMAVSQNHLERFGDKEGLTCVWDDKSVLDANETKRTAMKASRAAARAAREAELAEPSAD